MQPEIDYVEVAYAVEMEKLAVGLGQIGSALMSRVGKIGTTLAAGQYGQAGMMAGRTIRQTGRMLNTASGGVGSGILGIGKSLAASSAYGAVKSVGSGIKQGIMGAQPPKIPPSTLA